MLATHTIDPEELFTITAGGFSATADAFARDEETDGLWFVSMVGSQTALKAIWASLLKQPPDTAHIIKGADGMALSGGYKRCVIPHETVGTWTTKIARLPVSGGWHALVYTKTAEYGFEKDSFLLLAQSEEEAPALHHRFLDKRSPLPLHGTWADWLWRRGLDEGEIVPLQSVGVSAYRCSPKAGKLREDLSGAVASGWLTLPREEGGPMDRMLKRATRRNKRRGQRNSGAWRRFSPDGTTCRYCKHSGAQHLTASQDSPTSTGPPRKRRSGTPRSSSTATPCPRAAPCWCGGWSSPATPSSSPPSASRAPRASALTRCSATSATWASARWSGLDTERKDMAIAA